MQQAFPVVGPIKGWSVKRATTSCRRTRHASTQSHRCTVYCAVLMEGGRRCDWRCSTAFKAHSPWLHAPVCTRERVFPSFLSFYLSGGRTVPLRPRCPREFCARAANHWRVSPRSVSGLDIGLRGQPDARGSRHVACRFQPVRSDNERKNPIFALVSNARYSKLANFCRSLLDLLSNPFFHSSPKVG